MKLKKSKHLLILCFAAVLGTVLVVRLFMLTIFQHDKWQNYVDDVSQRSVYETAARGDILDRKGRILATSKPVYSVSLSRMNLTREKAQKAASQIITILNAENENIAITQEELNRSLEVNNYESYLPIVLADDVSEKTLETIKNAEIPGVQIDVNYKRVYPHGSTASHVIGYLGRISEEEYEENTGYRKDSLIGKDGIEKSFEQQLRGTDGTSFYRINSQGQINEFLGKTASKKGEDVQLTIDLELQETAEQALEKVITAASEGSTFESDYGACNMSYADKVSSGAAVAIEIETGKVLAMASFPDFDPNIFTGTITETEWDSLQQQNPYDPMSPSPLYNLATMTAVQPGSTFKPVTALAALKCGLDENKSLYDGGVINCGGTLYGCHLWNDAGKSHGYTDLKEALKVSCNYYFFDISCGKDFASNTSLGYDQTITNHDITEVAKNLGLGNRTGVEISESAGILPSESIKLQSVKNELKNYLLRESEYFFNEEMLDNRVQMRKNIEKITNWADNPLTLEEIIGKLGSADFVRDDKVRELAQICKYEYFDRITWTTGDTFNIAIGQGDNSYTTLQMGRYMASLGRGGRNVDLTLVETSSKNQKKTPQLNEIDVKYIIECLTGVTSHSDGSLYSIFGDFPYSVAAKTGTAQKSGHINEESEIEYLRKNLHLIASDVSWEDMIKEAQRLQKKYPDIYETQDMAVRRAVINLSRYNIDYEDIDKYKEKYDNFAWTVALAPAQNPEIAVAVMLVQGKTSLNAAPAVREIIGKYGDITGWEKSF